jgi:hypothetical protein
MWSKIVAFVREDRRKAIEAEEERRALRSPDATVDPSLFPEDEFPTYCEKCKYLLRGLPDGKCPECGTDFGRGKLLVRQYVLESGKRLYPRSARLAKWAFIAGFSLWVTVLLGYLAWSWSVSALAFGRQVQRVSSWVIRLKLISVILLLLSCGTHFIAGRSAREKRRRVLQAFREQRKQKADSG